MIYVEPSALVAILLEEADAATYRSRMMSEAVRVISVVGKVEASISVGRHIGDYVIGQEAVERICAEANIEVLPVYPNMYAELMRTYQRYGRGTGHAAKLNFGDCFSYATANREGASLLFKGLDFSKTDIDLAL